MGEIADGAADSRAFRRAVEGHVVEDRQDVSLCHLRDEPGTGLAVGKQQVVHVGVVNAVGGDNRTTDGSVGLQLGKSLVVAAPDPHSSAGDLLRLLQLSPEEGGADLSGAER